MSFPFDVLFSSDYVTTITSQSYWVCDNDYLPSLLSMWQWLPPNPTEYVTMITSQSYWVCDNDYLAVLLIIKCRRFSELFFKVIKSILRLLITFFRFENVFVIAHLFALFFFVCSNAFVINITVFTIDKCVIPKCLDVIKGKKAFCHTPSLHVSIGSTVSLGN